MHSVDVLRREVRELSNQRDTLAREDAALRTEYRELDARRREIAKRQEAIPGERTVLDAQVAALEQALAILEERLPADVPAPAAVPDALPLPDAERERVERELREMADARHEAERAAQAQTQPGKSRGGSKPGHFARDPLKVLERQSAKGVKRPKKNPIRRTINGEIPERLKTPTPTEQERADLVREVIAERGAVSQRDIGAAMTDLLGCKSVTAQGIVSDSLAILQHQRVIMWTGEKAPDNRGAKVSPIWKLRETPDEHASAGIASDDEANPQTTRPYTDTKGQRVTVESSQFEGKR